MNDDIGIALLLASLVTLGTASFGFGARDLCARAYDTATRWTVVWAVCTGLFVLVETLRW